ncbi:hypothetical protein A1O7_04093 [Cladophialophora yegresii CBS 114405]|uniref:Uncharacterized protein n=1 Tax=Cladophialophora yegresii CBS 114405 TaxID=1182544 RepID=W9W4M8_9EURO|nr:uncharacterized protein A1O7_04093 [Cladophialophora yegresii CBS 114405]EXJ59945.1 hypothetical protein A1O7_04093 [Cladophialophora yegresii CBS 114405]
MVSFLDFPFELRQQIYDLVLSTQQLKVQHIKDPAWADAEKPAGAPGLLLVNKAVYKEAAASFYSRAVLNIAHLRPPAYMFDSPSRNGLKHNLAIGLDALFAACQHHLQRIKMARVFSGQHDAINAEAYEALLHWLADNTAVREIYLSRRLTTRLRSARTNVDGLRSVHNAALDLSLLRTVHVYRPGARSAWEVTRMGEIKRALRGASLPILQAYILEAGGQCDALLDPRWDLRRSSTAEEVDALHDISAWLDSLLAADVVAQKAEQGHAQGGAWSGLYQVCFVFGRRQPDDV